MEAKKQLGEVVSRLAMAVVGVGLIFGGFKCLRGVNVIVAAHMQMNPNDHRYAYNPARYDSGIRLMLDVGYGLIFFGGVFGIASVAPLSLITRICSPPEY